MLYKEVTIHEDRDILDGLNDYQIGRAVGCSAMYINSLRHGKEVATHTFYTKLRAVLLDLKARGGVSGKGKVNT